MKNIDSAFRHIRMFSMLVIVSCIAICAYALYLSNSSIDRAQKRVYILASGKALEAFAADRKDNVPVEARDHVKMFHYYFFTLDPDDKVITANIKRALYLADGSAKQQYDNLRENGYYSNLIAGNISQEITTDSIVINMEQYPFYFRCYGLEKIIRPSTIVTRSLLTEGYLRNVLRSDNNSHGFLIEKWRVLENKDIKSENR